MFSMGKMDWYARVRRTSVNTTRHRLSSAGLLTVLVLAAVTASAVPPAAEIDPATQFTITAIETDAVKKEISVTFSEPVTMDVLRKNLKTIPPVAINWRESRLDAYNNRVTIRGSFRHGMKYLISLPEGLEVGPRRYVVTGNEFAMPDAPPSISFAEEKAVVERDSRQMIHLKVRNVEQLIFEGMKVPPIILPMALSSAGQPEGNWGDLAATLKKAADGIEAPGLKPFLGEVQKEKQIFYASGEKNKLRPFSVPMTFRSEKEQGALQLIRFYDNETGLKAGTGIRLFRITDLGLTYKLSSDDLLVWATSLRNGTPRKEVALLAFTAGMEAFPLGRTGSDGTFLYREKELDGWLLNSGGEPEPVRRPLRVEEITFLAAADSDDVSYMEVRTEGSLKPADIYQVKGLQDPGRVLKGYLFTERGIYRPGDTLYFKGFVREYAGGRISAPGEGTCSFEIFDAKNERILTSENRLSEFGTASGEMAIKTFYPLGTYTIKMRFGKEERETTSRTFQVQEFRRPRHFTELAFSRVTRRDTSYVNFQREADFLQIDIGGSYYAGGPVKHGQVRWKIYRARTEHAVEGHGDYSFGYPTARDRELLDSGESILDEKGIIQVEFPLDRETLNGKYGLEVAATVLDFDGRAASGSRRYQARPDYLVGIGRHPGKVEQNQPQILNLVVVDHQGDRIPSGKVEVEVLQETGTYIRKRNDQGDLFWDYRQVWKKRFSGVIGLEEGRGEFEFDFAWGGRYLLAFTYRDGSGTPFTSGTIFDVEWEYHWGDRSRLERPYDNLNLFAEKKTYQPGEKARIHLASERRAERYLVTLERRGILEHRVIESGKEARFIDIPIGEEHSPNIYVSVLGTLPRSEFPVYGGQYDDEAPTFLFGTLNLAVLKESQPLTVGISEEISKIKSEPGREVTLSITTRDREGRGVEAEVAFCVVDESVLALTGFTTPGLDSLSRFDAPLGVFTGDLRAFLLRQTPFDLVRVDPLTGGGGLAVDAEALTSKARKRFDPVAYFNPAVMTGYDGRAEVTFTLPDTMSTYRVYAVACDRGAGYGSRQRPLLAVKEFYLEPGLPRFFNRGDRFSFDVSAFNVTGEAGVAAFALQTGGGLELSSEKLNYPLEAHGSTRIPVTGKALSPGTATATFGSEFGDKRDAVEVSLPINTGHVLGSENLFDSFQGSKDVTFPLSEEVKKIDWEEVGLEETACQITISGSPFMRLTKGLRYLLRYPYGCVEQTSSSVIPLAALRALIREGLIPEITTEETDKFLKKGVNRLLGMQNRSGGFGYWPGNSQTHPWGSVYAASALTMAGEAGLDVPEAPMRRAMDYLKREIRRSGQSQVTLKSFMAFILSMNGSLDKATFDLVRKDSKSDNRESRILLLLAAHRGNLMPEEELRIEAEKVLKGRWTESRAGEFYARYREPAFSLILGSSVLRNDPLTDRLAEKLMGGIGREGIWTSTSDTGWSLFALNEYFEGVRFSDETVRVTVSQANGPSQTADLPARGFSTLACDPGAFLAEPSLTFVADSDSTVLFRIELTFPRIDYARAGHDGGFQVTKSIQNLDGTGTVRVGDMVEVKVNIQTGEGRYPYRYVVLDDPLPAGLVAINSALKTEEPPPGGRSADEDRFWYRTEEGFYRFVPGFFEIRDDRVLAFRDYLWGGAYQYSYYARAVCQGEFVMPSTKVQLMYDPEVAGYTPADTLRIDPR